jgi:hypothetical protein
MSLPVVVVVVDGYEFGTSQAWSLWRQDVSIIKSDLYQLAKLMIHATCLIKCLVEI